MANVINRKTFRYLQSVNTPDFDSADWLINPDLSGVQRVPARHWKVERDAVVEMTQAEKDVVDTPKANPARDSVTKKLKTDLRLTDEEVACVVN